MGSECLSFGQLAERGVLKFGDGYRTKSTELGETGFPILRVGIVADGRVKASVSNDLIRSEYRSSIGQKFSRLGDIVLTTKGTVGRTARIDIDTIGWVYSPQVCYFRVVDETVVHPGYLYAYMRSDRFKKQAEVLASQTDMAPYLSLKDLAGIEIDLPPLPEQRRIAKILGDLDDKIELNRTMNETLEAMARALFKSWFVDFDPVRAKMEGRKPEGMDAETAALFPDKLVESELGMIPEGWEVKALGDCIQLLSGGTPATNVAEYWGGNIPWFSVKDAPADSDVWVIRTEKQVTILGIQNSAAQILPEGTTIITARGTVGKLALVGTAMAMNQSCYGVRGANGYSSYFTHFVLREATMGIQSRSHGTVFDTITRLTFETLECVFPPAALTQAFDQAVAPQLEQIRANLHQSRILATLRDTLLPELMG